MASPHLAEQVGRVLDGRYRVVAPIGTGASAAVYLADDTTLRRRVALKVLHAALASDQGFLKRFQAEAHTAAALSHPNIMRVLDWGEAEDGPFLVLEYLGGGSLRAVLDQESRLTVEQTVQIGIQAARALDYAHRRGLVHRDIKPGNLLFDEEGRIAIADFGLARALAEAAWTEPGGAVLGTARYAAPEQVRGHSLDGKADVYALGLVLFEAVCGYVPFSADTTIATLMARLDAELDVPEELGVLGEIVARVVQPEREQRIDAAELVSLLEQAAATLPKPGRLTLPGAVSIDVRGLGDVDQTMLSSTSTTASTSATPMLQPSVSVEARPIPTELTPRPKRRVLRRRSRVASNGAASTEVASGGAVSTGVVSDRAASVGGGTDPSGGAIKSGSSGSSGRSGRSGRSGKSGRSGRAGRFGRPGNIGSAVPDGETSATPGRRQSRYGHGHRHGPASERDPGRGHRRGVRLPSWRKFVAALALVVLVVGAGGGAYAIYYNFTGQQRIVPQVENLTPEGARSAAEQADVKLSIDDEVYSETVPAGTTFDQAPDAGIEIDSRESVHVKISKGPAPRPVVDVVGQTIEAARPMLESRDFVVRTQDRFDETAPKGRVLEQTPNQGEFAKGSEVMLVLSGGPRPRNIPDVKGKSYEEALTAVTAQQLKVTQKEEFSNDVPAGQVAGTSPGPGVAVARDSTVTIVVSKGPELIAIPSVNDLTVQAATAKLESLGFRVTNVYGPAGGRVFDTGPTVGTKITKGSQVSLYTR